MLTIHKVTCFIIRRARIAPQLLVFDHPAGGIQLPAGTVERGERPLQAARREAEEETSLTALRRLCKLGTAGEVLPYGVMMADNISQLRAAPHPAAPLVAHPLHRGWRVNVGGVQDGFRFIRYEERNLNQPEAPLLWQVEGWLPQECLTRRVLRHFFLFECLEDVPESWECVSDLEYTFRCHWLPLSPSPPLTPPQDRWLRWLRWLKRSG